MRCPPVRAALLIASLWCCCLAAVASAQIAAGQTDDFEDGQRQNWQKGTSPVTTNTLTNVTTGGPEGTGDHFLRSTSSGAGGTGSHQTFFNVAQWRGNYITADVGSIEAKVRNFGASSLFLRIALQHGATGTQYASASAQVVANDGQWHTVTLGLGDADLALVGGTATRVQTLSDVSIVRIISRQLSAGWQGDVVASTLGIDDITARAVTPVRAITWGRIKRLYESRSE